MSNQQERLGRDEVYVRDARAAKNWYADLLGLCTTQYAPGWTMFILNGAGSNRDIALIQADENAPLPLRKRVGHGRIARELGDSDEFWACYEDVKAKGIAIERIADRGDSIALCLCDPDGNGVEIFYRYKSHRETGSSADVVSCGKTIGSDGLSIPRTERPGTVSYLVLRARAAA